jgi:hypothetical protein
MLQEIDDAKQMNLRWLKKITRRFVRKQNNCFEIVNHCQICCSMMSEDELLSWCKQNLNDPAYRIVCAVFGAEDACPVFHGIWVNEVKARFSNAALVHYYKLHPALESKSHDQSSTASTI